VIEFRTLGGLSLRNAEDGGGLDSILTRSKRVAVLSYLALARPPGFHRRSILTGTFWPDSPETKARRALNQAVYVLRSGLGSGVLVNRGDDELGLNRERLWCDAWAFDQAADSGDLVSAVELYGGRLLNGFYVDDWPEFEHWLDNERMHYHRRAVDVAMRLASSLEADGEAEQAAACLRKATRWAPNDEAIAAKLIELLAGLGHRAVAIQHYESFSARLSRDLDLEPSVDLSRLVQNLRATNGPNGPETDAGKSDREERADSVDFDGSVSVDGGQPGHRGPRPPPESRVVSPGSRGRRPWLWAACIGALLLGAAAAIRLLSPQAGVAVVEARRVLVVPASNGTGDPSLYPIGSATADWLATGLAETGLVEVVSPADMAHWASKLRAQGDSIDDPTYIHELAKRTGARLLVTGRYLQTDDSLRFLAQISDVVEGSLLRSVESRLVPLDDPLTGAEDLRRRLMGALGTAVDSRFSSWANAASQPPSMQAYQQYAEGIDLYRRRKMPEAADRFFSASKAEPTFTAPLVWASLALTADWSGNEGSTDSERWTRADSVTQVLEEIGDRLPAWELAMVDRNRAALTHDHRAAYDAWRRVNEVAPNSEWLLNQATVAMWMNRPREALETLDRIDPSWPWFESHQGRYWNLRLAQLHRLGRYEEELEAVHGIRRETQRQIFTFTELRALAGLGLRDEVEQMFETIVLPRAGMSGRAFVELMAHGFDELAMRGEEEALRVQHETPETERDIRWLFNTSHILNKLERYDEAYDLLRGVTPSDDAYMDALGSIGYLEAKRGNRDAALRIMDELLASRDRDFMHFLRASIAAALGDKKRAVRELRQMTIRGVMHPEAYLYELRGYEPFEEWLKPGG